MNEHVIDLGIQSGLGSGDDPLPIKRSLFGSPQSVKAPYGVTCEPIPYSTKIVIRKGRIPIARGANNRFLKAVKSTMENPKLETSESYFTPITKRRIAVTSHLVHRSNAKNHLINNSQTILPRAVSKVAEPERAKTTDSNSRNENIIKSTSTIPPPSLALPPLQFNLPPLNPIFKQSSNSDMVSNGLNNYSEDTFNSLNINDESEDTDDESHIEEDVEDSEARFRRLEREALNQDHWFERNPELETKLWYEYHGQEYIPKSKQNDEENISSPKSEVHEEESNKCEFNNSEYKDSIEEEESNDDENNHEKEPIENDNDEKEPREEESSTDKEHGKEETNQQDNSHAKEENSQ